MTARDLRAEARDASTAADVLAVVSAVAWANANDDAECPAHRIPNPAELAELLPASPGEDATAEVADATAAAVELANDAWQTLTAHGMPRENGAVRFGVFGFKLPSVVVIEAAGHLKRTEIKAGDPDLLVIAMHLLWKTGDRHAPDLPHPLTPLVACWQMFAPVPVEADRRPSAILPATLSTARREHADQLPLSLDVQTPMGSLPAGEQGYLPGMDPEPSALVPVLPLALYDLAGGAMSGRGRGAPVAQRLFFEVLMSVGRMDRHPGQTARAEVTYRDLVRWLWPNLRGRTWKRQQHLPALYRALLELDGMRIEWERQLWRLVAVQALPTAATRPDDPAVFRVEHLPGSHHGPRIDRDALRRWGLVSAPAWRAYLRLAYLWDKAKGANNGARIYATRPIVARGPGGVILGENGHPLRDYRGAVVTDWSDRRAVILGADGKPAGADNPAAYERNPAADRVPVLGPDDLIRLGFNGDMDLNRRKRLYLARQALAAMEAAGQVVREPDGHGGERIVEIRPAPGG